MKRIIILIYLLFLAAFCFSQQNMPRKIYGGIPNANSTKLYEIQIGAFEKMENAKKYIAILEKNGYIPVYEQYLHFTRVKITGISAKEIRSYLIKVKQMGFDAVIVREDSTPRPVVNEPEPEEPEPEIEPEEEIEEIIQEIIVEAVKPEITPEPPKKIERDIFCRTWVIVSSDKAEYIGYIMLFSEDGSYLITNTKGEPFVAKWRWHNELAAFEYTHDNWRSYGRVDISELDNNSLIFTDPGFNILGNGYSTVRKDVVFKLVPIEHFQQDTSE
jgi:hypothetical protein